jgi:hypothetical protein
MKKTKIQEEIEPEEIDEIPEEIPDDAKPKLSLNERRMKYLIYAN